MADRVVTDQTDNVEETAGSHYLIKEEINYLNSLFSGEAFYYSAFVNYLVDLYSAEISVKLIVVLLYNWGWDVSVYSEKRVR